jgi:hypothetical protein
MTWGGFYGALPAPPTPAVTEPTGPTWCELPRDHLGDCHRVVAGVLLGKRPDGQISQAGLCGMGADGWRVTALVPTTSVAKGGRRR